MRRIVILACIVALAFAGISEVAFDSYTGIYSSGNSGFKKYNKPEWNNEVDFGVYFWFKINSQYPSPNWSTIYTLTANPDNTIQDAVNLGDRILSAFIRGNQISSCTSTPGNGNANHILNYDTTKDVDQWGFYYQAYSGTNKRLITVIQMAQTYIIDKLENIVHQPSSYYKVIWGQSFSYGYFPGTIYKFVVQGGGNIYREDNWDDLINQYNPASYDNTLNPINFKSVNSNSQSEVVADQYIGNYSSGNSGFKRYTKTVWDQELDFGVYFWFKIDSRYPSPAWSTIFTLTANPDNTIQDAVILGDRILSSFLQGNQISICTSTPGNGNAHHILSYDTSKDVDKWSFYYQAYSGSKKRIQTYIQMGQTYTDTLDGITHYPSNYYKLFWGKSFGYGYFPGTISKLVLQGGGNIYRESGYDALSGLYNPNNPTPSPPINNSNCILIYQQENYQGTPINACSSINNLDIHSIRSVTVPKGSWMDLYDQQSYKGKFTRISQSYAKFPPLDQLVWQVKTSFSQKKLSKQVTIKQNQKRD